MRSILLTAITAIGVALGFGAIPAQAQHYPHGHGGGGWHEGGGHHGGGGGWHGGGHGYGGGGYGGYHHHHHPGGFNPGYGYGGYYNPGYYVGGYNSYYYPPQQNVFVPDAGPRYMVPAEFVGTPVGSTINYGGYNYLVVEDGSVMIPQ